MGARLDNIANPSACKAHVVQAIKAMQLSLVYGDQVSGQLSKSTEWAQYEKQNHDRNNEWPCPECDEKFSRGQSLQSHMKSVHEIEMVLPPEESGRTSSGSGNSSAAVGQMFGIWGCDMCSQKFKTEGWMQRHKQKIHGVPLPEGAEGQHSILGQLAGESGVSPPRADSQDIGLKALAAAAGADRMAMFHCDFPVSSGVYMMPKDLTLGPQQG